MAFTPKRKTDIKDIIKNILLEGNIIRYDSREEKPIEVLDRKYINDLSDMGNIGSCCKPIIENINCSHKVFHEVKSELEQDYSVKTIRCRNSGCCQYSTYGTYIE